MNSHNERWFADDTRNWKSKSLSPPLGRLRYEFMLNQLHIPCRTRLVRMTTRSSSRHCQRPYWNGLDHLTLRILALISVSLLRERRDSYVPTLHTLIMCHLSPSLDTLLNRLVFNDEVPCIQLSHGRSCLVLCNVRLVIA